MAPELRQSSGSVAAISCSFGRQHAAREGSSREQGRAVPPRAPTFEHVRRHEQMGAPATSRCGHQRLPHRHRFSRTEERTASSVCQLLRRGDGPATGPGGAGDQRGCVRNAVACAHALVRPEAPRDVLRATRTHARALRLRHSWLALGTGHAHVGRGRVRCTAQTGGRITASRHPVEPRRAAELLGLSQPAAAARLLACAAGAATGGGWPRTGEPRRTAALVYLWRLRDRELPRSLSHGRSRPERWRQPARRRRRPRLAAHRPCCRAHLCTLQPPADAELKRATDG